MNNSFLALKYYNKAYQLDPNVNPIILYKIARGYQFRLQLKKAEKTYNQFISEYNKTDKKDWEGFVKKRIKECHTANKLLKNFVGGMVVNLKGVNSKFDDHSPLVTLDENTMYFTSRRLDGNHGSVDAQGQAFEDIYVAHKSKKGVWQKPKNLGEVINTKNHDATIGLFPNEDRLYIYKGKLNKGDIWITKKTKEGWTKPEALPAPINSKYQETAISFSPDGKTVYFVTDRPNGVGKKDIWKADVKEDGTFVNAAPLDTTINTIEDERSVFLQQDGKTMYFSSKGHEGMGGFDIFKAHWVLDDSTHIRNVANLGYPVNTPLDDKTISLSKSGRYGYIASFRNDGFGDLDIYRVIFKDEQPRYSVIRGAIYGPDSTRFDVVIKRINDHIDTLNFPVNREYKRLLLKKKDTAAAYAELAKKIPYEKINVKIIAINKETGETFGNFIARNDTANYSVILPPGRWKLIFKRQGYDDYIIDDLNCCRLSRHSLLTFQTVRRCKGRLWQR